LRVAILAWGSLVWDRKQLALATEFLPRGSRLPIAFSRISRDGRLTLVIDEENALCHLGRTERLRASGRGDREFEDPGRHERGGHRLHRPPDGQARRDGVAASSTRVADNRGLGLSQRPRRRHLDRAPRRLARKDAPVDYLATLDTQSRRHWRIFGKLRRRCAVCCGRRSTPVGLHSAGKNSRLCWRPRKVQR